MLYISVIYVIIEFIIPLPAVLMFLFHVETLKVYECQ